MFESQVARRESAPAGDSAPSLGERGQAAPAAGPTLESATRLGHHLGGFGLARPIDSPIQRGKRKGENGEELDDDEEETPAKKVKPNWHQFTPDLSGPPGPPPSRPSSFLSRAPSMPIPLSVSPFASPPSPYPVPLFQASSKASPPSPFSVPLPTLKPFKISPPPPGPGLGRSLSFGSSLPSSSPLQVPRPPLPVLPPPPPPSLDPMPTPSSDPLAVSAPFGGPPPPSTVTPSPQGVPSPPPPSVVPPPSVSVPQPSVSPTPSVSATPSPKPTPWVPPGSEPMLRPLRPTFRKKDVNKPADPGLVQPITTVVPKAVEPGPLLSGSALDERLADIPDGAPKVPIATPVDKLRQFAGASSQVKGMVGLTGGNQGGLYPEDSSQVAHLPESADYTASRPQQLLSQLGEVFLHHGNKAKVNPVEVQFGYGQKSDGSVDLYSSTNNKESQDWLLEALKTPVLHLKAAAKDKDHPDIARVAQKILFFKEQNAKRREEIRGKPNEAELEKQIQLAEKIHASFFADPVRVATNDADRHAEQNIADVMHGKGYISGDIQGPKIRCEGCSSELGLNLQDESGTKLIGRVYASQADPKKHKSTFAGIKSGKVKVATNRTERSRSSSPVRVKPKPKPAPGSSPLTGPAVATAGPPKPPPATKPSLRKPEKDDDTPMSVPSPSTNPPSAPPAFLFSPPLGPPLPPSSPYSHLPPPPPPRSDGARQATPSPKATSPSSGFDSLFDDA